MIRYHVDVEKDYVLLCLRKWLVYSSKQELIPKLELDYYLTEAVKVTKVGVKKATVIYCMIDGVNQLSIEVYRDRLLAFLKETFYTVWMVIEK